MGATSSSDDDGVVVVSRAVHVELAINLFA